MVAHQTNLEELGVVIYKHSITAENSTTRDSLYIKESFRLRIRFAETGLWGEKKQLRKNVKI